MEQHLWAVHLREGTKNATSSQHRSHRAMMLGESWRFALRSEAVSLYEKGVNKGHRKLLLVAVETRNEIRRH